MYKYFTKINSFEDLKTQFRALARQHHPDVGGDPDIMKAINAEYDSLFPIWKQRCNPHTNETAETTRREFYTANGWKGENYDGRRTLKEVAAIVREYVKKKYPKFKFSVTKDTYNRLSVVLKEAYTNIFASQDCKGDYYNSHSYYQRDAYIPEVKNMLDDITAFVNSYNYEDIDGQIDYFDVGFWFHGVKIAYGFKVNPTLAAKGTTKTKSKAKTSTKSSVNADSDNESMDYEIRKTIHTKTGETIWVVKLLHNLSRDEYIAEANRMKKLGGYYSRYVHGFIFKTDPTDNLVA